MAYQGRGNSFKALAIATILLVSLALHLKTAQATDYIVGDDKGWGFGVEGWEKGKSFKAGDNLIFKYNPQNHDVVKDDADGYDACMPSPNSPIFTSGNDKVTLSKGSNYFFCTFPDHCERGMKIEAIAS